MTTMVASTSSTGGCRLLFTPSPSLPLPLTCPYPPHRWWPLSLYGATFTVKISTVTCVGHITDRYLNITHKYTQKNTYVPLIQDCTKMVSILSQLLEAVAPRIFLCISHFSCTYQWYSYSIQFGIIPVVRKMILYSLYIWQYIFKPNFVRYTVS